MRAFVCGLGLLCGMSVAACGGGGTGTPATCKELSAHTCDRASQCISDSGTFTIDFGVATVEYESARHCRTFPPFTDGEDSNCADDADAWIATCAEAVTAQSCSEATLVLPPECTDSGG